jgi:hypothetical protein
VTDSAVNKINRDKNTSTMLYRSNIVFLLNIHTDAEPGMVTS